MRQKWKHHLDVQIFFLHLVAFNNSEVRGCAKWIAMLFQSYLSRTVGMPSSLLRCSRSKTFCDA
jgi:hypothetical protein